MVEASEIRFGEEEEIELDLGLSIGGSFRKSENPKPDSKSNGFGSDLRDFHHHHHHHHHEACSVERERMVDMGMDSEEEAKKKRKQKSWVTESEPEDPREFKREKMDHDTAIGSTTSFPMQYVPFDNGCFTFFGAVNVGQPPATACRGLRSFLGNGCESELNGARDGVNGSSNNSSVVSEHHNSSHEDGGSIDSHSHSAHSLAEPTLLNSSNKENNIRSQLEQSASSHPVRSENGNLEGRNHIVKEIHPKITQPEPTKLKEEATMNSKAVPIEKHLSNENSSNGPLKETKTEMGKPPKPVSQTSSLPQMPYVSTTGNGPNGKTVNGFLYRYTKSEVSIVCVCHGSTFSPAEFVQHAGGTDISHPLRHITVIPSAFG